MKHVKKFDDFLNESLSKINPGKKILAASIAGSQSAASYVSAAQKAVQQWAKITEEIKKARKNKEKDTVNKLKETKKQIVDKLVELKKQALQKYGEELKKAKVPSEKKAAAKKKAEQVDKQFTASIEAQEEKKEETPKVDTEAIKSEMDKIKEEMKKMEDEFYDKQDKEADEWRDMMNSKGFDDSDWLGDNGWGEATDMYDDYQSEKSKKEEEFYNKLQSMADKYEALEKQLEQAEGKNESYIWESIDRILEFDAQAMVDKAKERAEKSKEKLEDFQKKKEEGESGEDEEGDDDNLSKSEEIERQLDELEAEWKKRKQELIDLMDKAEEEGDDSGQGGKVDKIQAKYAKEESEYKKKIEELEDELSKYGPGESYKFTGGKYLHTFESFINKR